MNLKNITLWKSIFSSRSPPEISFEISGRTWCYSSKIDFFITIAPRNFVLNISTSPPTARSAENVYICWNVSFLWTYFPSLERAFFLTSPPSARSAELFLNVIEQSFIFCLNDDFHQPRPQYALRTIDHTTLYVSQYSLVVLKKSEEQARAARKLYWL